MYNFIRYHVKLKPETLEELSLIEFKYFWNMISSNQVLSEPFIEKYSNKLNWYWISESQNLSLEFLIKHKDKIDLNLLLWHNTKIPQKNKDKFYKEITNKNI